MGIDYITPKGTLAVFLKNVIQDVINRKGVILANTYGIDLFKKMNPIYKLMKSDTKYAQTFVYSVVHKNTPHYSRIIRL